MPDMYPLYEWPPRGDVPGDLIGIPWCLFGIGTDDESLGSPCYGFSAVMPDLLLPIGTTTSNDVVCIGCADAYAGHVYHWSSLLGNADFGTEGAVAALTFVATDFKEFWDSLVLIEDDAIVG
jgi:hypothetical protein